ncbi:dnaJ homolog subfamily B member 12-like [Xiphias gladius]|uniref:dnaJ homolog subfamily B member 12-like n=1 Tax=Xiphias gladius TaxID=8245 RepID=UPI001A999E12|nr:dnaJ homolog subfamily B member 12-like [Xiphias gladius]
MAEVRQRFGKGAYDFAHKIYNRQLLESPNKPVKAAAQASHLSAGFLPGGIKRGDLYGAENAADRVTVGASRDSYTRVTPVLGALTDMWERGNVVEYYCYRRRREYSLFNKTRVQIIERNLPRCRTNAKFRRTFCTSSPYSRRLCWGHGQFVFIRDYGGNGTRSEPLYKTKTGYYEILEVLPTATHAQIKTAYYKQSFVYHPDRNAGTEEATVRFSEISEAYTVLGNKALRKKYDRGLLSQSDLTANARPAAKDRTGSPAKQQAESRRSVVGVDTGGGVFDFDKFFKSHYNEQLQRQRDIRVRKEERQKEKQEAMGERRLGRMMELCVGVMLLMAAGIMISLKRG